MEYIKEDRKAEIVEQEHPRASWKDFVVSLWERFKLILERFKRFLQTSGAGLLSFMKSYGLLFALLFAGAAGLGYAGYLMRKEQETDLDVELIRLRRARPGNARQFIIFAYHSLQRVFAKKGAPRKAYWTPHDYEKFLSRDYHSFRPHIERLTRLFTSARYSLDTLQEDHRREAYRSLEHIIAALIKEKQGGQRI